ncbi:MAG: hypothetical protein Q8N88_05125 [Nanoarchaeota archaeon]|nr:hypothetical protein [Nanoarchaeota archaeon]
MNLHKRGKMESLAYFALKEQYSKVRKLRSRLENMNKIIDWCKFLELFPEKISTVGRPNYDKILLIKFYFCKAGTDFPTRNWNFKLMTD